MIFRKRRYRRKYDGIRLPHGFKILTPLSHKPSIILISWHHPRSITWRFSLEVGILRPGEKTRIMKFLSRGRLQNIKVLTIGRIIIELHQQKHMWRDRTKR